MNEVLEVEKAQKKIRTPEPEEQSHTSDNFEVILEVQNAAECSEELPMNHDVSSLNVQMDDEKEGLEVEGVDISEAKDNMIFVSQKSVYTKP